MSQLELLNQLVATLNRLAVPYMLTGSVVSSIQGEPRASHDIDVVIVLQPASIPELVAAFPSEDFYLDEYAIREAIREPGGMFNLIDMRSGDKVDFWLRQGDAWSRNCFGRRIQVTVDGQQLWVSTPEDTILSKLRWSKLCGGSEKQIHDVRRVMEIQRDQLDIEYLRDWSKRLDVADSLEPLLDAVMGPG